MESYHIKLSIVFICLVLAACHSGSSSERASVPVELSGKWENACRMLPFDQGSTKSNWEFKQSTVTSYFAYYPSDDCSGEPGSETIDTGTFIILEEVLTENGLLATNAISRGSDGTDSFFTYYVDDETLYFGYKDLPLSFSNPFYRIE